MKTEILEFCFECEKIGLFNQGEIEKRAKELGLLCRFKEGKLVAIERDRGW